MQRPSRIGGRPILVFATVMGAMVLGADLALDALASRRESPVPEEAAPAARREPADAAGRFLQAVEYVASDYREAVRGGKVLDPGEYEEQVEFLAKARDLLGDFPPSPLRDGLRADLHRAAAAARRLAEPEEMEAILKGMSGAVVAAGLASSEPAFLPDPRRGADLFAANCSSCHGPEGRGDGPAGRSLVPRPADFHDEERMEHATPLKLFHAVRYGVDGTAMPSYAALSEEDLWALAYFVRSLGHAPEDAVSGIQ